MTRRTVADTWDIAATHEAGHAVVATLCGTTVRDVTIDVHSRLFGSPTPEGNVEADELTTCRRLKPADFLLDCMAGGAAEAVLYDTWGWPSGKIGRAVEANTGWDRQYAAEQLAARGLALTRRELRRAESDAADVIASHWDEVRAVAAALIDGGGRLSGRDVKRVMRT